MLKSKDISVMSIVQLEEKLIELKKDQMSLRFQKALGQLEKPFRKRVIGRDIARVKTMINSKLCEKNS
ncbi:50S ribosomal protein L29 [Candidatus Liberibacter africanus]|uniref:Large ribosomal subunit protein uL29 n=1 Tax=Candidatus Liberibacter africanus PTSAPSY TaxID=1277257 RepID=A0A0G3I7X7_LIBAF|nr:50S ribosomal protein L29 [Candidatus Liberibacter africanus]AKK19822.1 ribosomal protein L29 [Candidatus Liberibacter africanus PTSAPSY]QTP63685.1 50S ribosomal protein L29 [Candidatus Liberibacter africanus]